MRLETETYAVTSYEEMEEARLRANGAIIEFRLRHKNFLITCLCEVGFANKTVRVKKTGDTGVLTVEEKGYTSFYPYEIKFYPFKKNGDISLKSRYLSQFNQMHGDTMIQELLNCFELVGDENAS